LNTVIGPYHRIRNELAVQDGKSWHTLSDHSKGFAIKFDPAGACHSSRHGPHKAETEDYHGLSS